MTTEKEISIWAKALMAIMEGGDKQKTEKAGGNLAKILRKKKKGYLLPKIIERTSSIYFRKYGIKIFFAKDHPSAFIKKITQKLLSAFKNPPKEIEICKEEDLIGGFRVQGGNFLMKASIKDFLRELKNNVD